jgi:hypothetical protein
MTGLGSERGGKVPYINKNAIIAGLVGLLFLAVSYWGVDKGSFLRDLCHEIGFALVVAVTIWVTFEFFARADTEDHWNERIEKITKNVFLGVFKRNFPDEFIREAHSLVLDHTFIRYGLNVTYTISDGSYANRDGQTQKFVKLNAVARYRIKNVGNSAARLPLGIELPNPMIEEMKPTCKVSRISVKRGGTETKIDLSAAEEAFREAIKNDNNSQVKFEVPNISVGQNEEIEVVFDYVMAKEEEDTEIFQTRYPTDSVGITIMDRGPTARAVRARSIHGSNLEDDTSAERTGTYNFKLSKYLLPYQGFVIWWKKVPNEPQENSGNQQRA